MTTPTAQSQIDQYLSCIEGKGVPADMIAATVNAIIKAHLNLETREAKFSDAEFALIDRNDEGRILDRFDLVWCFCTDAQKSRMHSDDQSRGDEVDEELRILMSEFL